MRSFARRAALGIISLIALTCFAAFAFFLRPVVASAGAVAHPDATATSCASLAACGLYDNRSTGSALEGETGKGIGLFGDAFKGGVGVNGTSVSGTGVVGTSTSGTGVFAKSGSSMGNAIEAVSGAGGPLFAGLAQSANVFGVDGTGDLTNAGTITAQQEVIGGFGDASSTGGEFLGFNYGVMGSNYPQNLEGSGSGYAVYASGYGGDLFVGNNDAAMNVFDVDNSGDVTIAGTIKTAGSCSGGCVRRAGEPGVHVVSYVPRESEPTMEDFGEGQLTNGAGYVRFDAAFAQTIDGDARYMVFVTPEGDNRGLYVTRKSAAGFAVRESQGGRSTLAFDWRVVAKPYGVSDARLPLVDVTPDARAKNALAAKLKPARPR